MERDGAGVTRSKREFGVRTGKGPETYVPEDFVEVQIGPYRGPWSELQCDYEWGGTSTGVTSRSKGGVSGWLDVGWL